MADQSIRVVIKGFAGDLRRALRDARSDLRGFSRDVQREDKTIVKSNRDVHRSFLDIDGAVGRFNRSLVFLRNVIKAVKWPVMITGAGVAAQAIGQLTAGVFSLIGSLQDLTGLLVAYPSAIGTVVQALGTWKLAVGEIGAALGGNEEALKRLTRAQRDFYDFLKRDYMPLVKELKNEAAEGLLPGLERGLGRARGNFGVVRTIIGDTAEEMGRLAEQAGKLVGSRAFGRDLAIIGEQNRKMLAASGDSALGLAKALSIVMVEAEPLLRYIRRGVRDFGDWAEESAKAGRRTGELRDFFVGTRETLQVILPMFRDFALGLRNIFSGGEATGDSMLRSLRDTAREFRLWTESAKGKNSIAQYFEDAEPGIREIAGLMTDLGGVFIRLSSGAGSLQFVRALRADVIPALEDLIGGTTAAFGPHLITMLTSFIETLSLLTGPTGALTVMLDALRIASDLLRALLSIPVVGSGVMNLLTLFAVFKGLKWAGAVSAAMKLAALWKTIAGYAVVSGAAGTVGSGLPVPVPGGKGGKAPMPGADQFGIKTAAANAAAGAGGASLLSRLKGGFKAAMPGIRTLAKGTIGVSLALGLVDALSASDVNLKGRIATGVRGMLFGLGPDIEKESRKAMDNALRNLAAGRDPNATKQKRSFLGIDSLAADTSGFKFLPDEVVRKFYAFQARIAQAEKSGNGFSAIVKSIDRFVAKHPTATAAADDLKRHLESVRATANAKYAVLDFGNKLNAEKPKVTAAVNDLLGEIRKMPPGGREAAARTALNIARELREKGKLSKTEMRGLRDALVKSMREARTRAGAQAGGMSKEVAAKIKTLNDAVENGLIGMWEATNASLKLLGFEGISVVKGKGSLASRIRTESGEKIPMLKKPGELARGGVVQFGKPGDNGRDTIPANIGGHNVMVGSGEIGVVANRTQQAGLNMLAQMGGYGNLQGFMQANSRPHYLAGGGIVALGRELQRQGYQVGEHPAFGGVHPVHVPNSRHYVGNALDVNADGKPGGEAAWLDRLAPQLMKAGWHVLWRVADHFDHLHVDGAGNAGVIGAPVEVPGMKLQGVGGALGSIGQGYLDTVHELLADAVGNTVGGPGGTGSYSKSAGGDFSKQQLMALWVQAGGNPASANLAAAVALAESGGRSGATNSNSNGTIDRGLWQINSIHGALSTMDPLGNARAAVRISGNGSNWAPWVAYQKGAHAAFLAGGGIIGAASGLTVPKGYSVLDTVKPKANPYAVGPGVGVPGNAPYGGTPYAPDANSRDEVLPAPPLKKKRRRKKPGHKKSKAIMPISKVLGNLTRKVEDERGAAGNAETRFGLPSSLLGEALAPSEQGELVMRWQEILGNENARLFLTHGVEGKARTNRKRYRTTADWQIRDTLRHSREIGRWQTTIKGIRDTAEKRPKGKRALTKLEKQRIERLQKSIAFWRKSNLRMSGLAEPKNRHAIVKTGQGYIARTLADVSGATSLIGSMNELQRPGGIPADILDAQTNLERARAGSPTEDATQDDSALAALMAEQLRQTRLALRVQTAQLDVFRGFAPFVGRFKHGGPVVEDGLAYVHRGERILPEQDGPFVNRAALSRTAAGRLDVALGFDERSLLQVIDRRIEAVTGDVSVNSGRRAGRLSRAPGR